jgi:hypothetical protein
MLNCEWLGRHSGSQPDIDQQQPWVWRSGALPLFNISNSIYSFPMFTTRETKIGHYTIYRNKD